MVFHAATYCTTLCTSARDSVQISRQDGRRVGCPAGRVPSGTCGADVMSLGETMENRFNVMTLRLCYGSCLYLI